MRKCTYKKCGSEYEPKVWWQKYCSPPKTCKWKDWNQNNPRIKKEALKEAQKALEKK